MKKWKHWTKNFNKFGYWYELLYSSFKGRGEGPLPMQCCPSQMHVKYEINNHKLNISVPAFSSFFNTFITS